jgi:hypothetical protein
MRFAALCMFTSSVAAAQYKNESFALDAGYWGVTRPSMLAADGTPLVGAKRPLRLQEGLRIGGSYNVKLDADHTWWIFRVNVGALRFGVVDSPVHFDDRADEAADLAIGTVLGIEGMLGVRYFFATDQVRPYLQAATSYMRLLSFSDAIEESCAAEFCGSGETTNLEAYLGHRNVFMLHLQPGIEFILQRDLALHLYADLNRWIIFNADDNPSVVGGLGVSYYF